MSLSGETIKLTFGAGIQIDHASYAVKERLKETLTLPNPLFARMLRMGKSTFGTPKTFSYFKNIGRGVLVPRGVETRLMAFFGKTGVAVAVDNQRVNIPRERVLAPCTKLRPYQEEAVQTAIASSIGILQLGTGAGKTLTACEIVARLPVTALILVPNTAILNQFVQEFKTFYSIGVGVVGDGTKDIQDITIATFQSLQADPLLARTLCERTSLLIVDECQGAVSDKRANLLWRFKASHIYGLSATPYRSSDDGRSDAVGFFFGPVLFSHEGLKLKPRVEVIQTDCALPVGDYQKMSEMLSTHTERNSLIAGIAAGEALTGRRVLILTKRIKHAAALYTLLQHMPGVLHIEADNADKNALLQTLRLGLNDFSILIGTTSLLAVGVDVPSLDTLVIACDLKSDVLTAQSAGRILRLFEGKTDPIIFDLYDNKNPIFARQFFARRTVYESKGWDIHTKYD